MSKKKHVVICLSNLEFKQIKLICDERKLDIDSFIVNALENEIKRILVGQEDK